MNGRRPLFAQQIDRAFNPASVMKLVTTFAALELLGPDYRWKTEAYLGGTLQGGVLHGDLVLKGGGDPKITVEQWQTFMTALRARGLDAVDGDLVLDRTFFAPVAHDPAAFDREPLKPYNVGPDALLDQFQIGSLRVRPAHGRRRTGRDGRARAFERRGRQRRRSSRAASAAIGARTCARCSPIRARGPRSLFRAVIRPPAASASCGSRCSTIRRTCTRCSTRTFAPPAAASPAACAAASHRAARRRSPRSNPRRSGTSCATSTSSPTM